MVTADTGGLIVEEKSVTVDSHRVIIEAKRLNYHANKLHIYRYLAQNRHFHTAPKQTARLRGAGAGGNGVSWSERRLIISQAGSRRERHWLFGNVGQADPPRV